MFKDGVYDAWYSDNWPQQVEELVPLEISQLFFFDAEKIRTLTEDETSSQALGAAIKSLLGPGHRRAADRRRRGHPGPAGEGGGHGGTSRQGRGPGEPGEGARRADQAIERGADGAGEPRRSGHSPPQQTAEMKFIASGGRYWELRQVREGKKKELETRVGEIEAQLLKLAAGELPLAMVPDLLEAGGAPGLAGAAVEPGGRRVGAAGRARRGAARCAPCGRRPARSSCELAQEYLERDRQERRAAMGSEPRLSLSPPARCAAPPPEQPPARRAAAGRRRAAGAACEPAPGARRPGAGHRGRAEG